VAKIRFTLPYPHADHEVFPQEFDNDRDRRIASVMPRVVSQLNKFRANLRPNEVPFFDLDDLLQEIWITLCEKDHYFDPERSKYITFANLITNQKLADVRNRWHTVEGPRDTAARLRREDLEDPRLIESIRHTIRDVTPLTDECLLVDETDRAEESDLQKQAREMVLTALQQLSSPLMVLVLKWAYGLLDHHPKSTTEIAERMKISVNRVTMLKKRAHRELAGICERLGYSSYI
jgi:RNA polymerase sigma factor (sigma-70 family)